MKFCFKLIEKRYKDFFIIQRTYKMGCLSSIQCHEWHQCFKQAKVIEDSQIFTNFHIDGQRPYWEYLANHEKTVTFKLWNFPLKLLIFIPKDISFSGLFACLFVCLLKKERQRKKEREKEREREKEIPHMA